MTESPQETIVRMTDVSRRFGSFQALRGLSMEIRKGDIYGLLGLNGAGKTTTIRILLGLLGADEGSIEVFGNRRSAGWRRANDRIGATIEAPAFYPHLTGLANLKLLHNLSRDRAGGRSPEQVLEMTGLAEAGGRKAGKYSQGMRQRLYIAQALLAKTELLILDEPTSNLDPRGIAEVRQLIRRLNQEMGLTVILSSHQLTEVEGLCSRVCIINKGRMIVESTMEGLFSIEESRIHIKLVDAERAETVVRALDWCIECQRVEDGLRVRIHRDRRAELNALLVREGFAVTDFHEKRPTLEDFFHEKIAGDGAEAARDAA